MTSERASTDTKVSMMQAPLIANGFWFFLNNVTPALSSSNDLLFGLALTSELVNWMGAALIWQWSRYGRNQYDALTRSETVHPDRTHVLFWSFGAIWTVRFRGTWNSLDWPKEQPREVKWLNGCSARKRDCLRSYDYRVSDRVLVKKRFSGSSFFNELMAWELAWHEGSCFRGSSQLSLSRPECTLC